MIRERTIMVFLESTGVTLSLSTDEKDCLFMAQAKQTFKDEDIAEIQISKYTLYIRDDEINVISRIKAPKLNHFEQMREAVLFIEDHIISSISKYLYNLYGQGDIFSQRDYSILRHFFKSFIMDAELISDEEHKARIKIQDTNRLYNYISSAKTLASSLGLDISDLESFEEKYFSEGKE
jgi:hypothetical protein